MSTDAAPKAQSWHEIGEAGALLGIRFLAVVATAFGRWPVRLMLKVIVFYYALFNRRAMAASRLFLQRLGVAHGFWDCYRHLLRFAECTTDRLFFIRGMHHLFEVHTHGHENLVAIQQSGKGAILLGAHLGSFEAMHATGDLEGHHINVVGYFGNAKRINQVLATVGRGVHATLIEVQPGDVTFALKLRECLERGELVAVLGDRSVGGASVPVQFLGHTAHIAAGVYAIASVLKCPVYLTFGLFTPPNRYDLYCEPFAERIELPRNRRAEATAQYAQRYADRLAHYCAQAPHNWFNFYDFWDTHV